MRKLVYNALVILGVWESTGPKMLLEKPAQFVENGLGPYIAKPLFACPMCMASVWGLSFYFFRDKFKWVWHVLALCGLMKLIMVLVFEGRVSHKNP